MLQFLKREELSEIIQRQNGKFFTVAFQKIDGSPRKMNARTGVKKYSNGGKQKGGDNLVNVYDVKNKGYRFINLATTMVLNAEKKTYVIVT